MLSFCIAQGTFRICLFSEQSIPCSWTLSKWSPYYYKKGVPGIDLPLSLTFTCSASFLTSLKTCVKAVCFVRVMHLVPPVTEQERKWCTAAGEHERAQYHSLSCLLLPHALGKSARWIKGSIFRESTSAVRCSINAYDVVVCRRHVFQEWECPLRSKHWCTLTAPSTSHLGWLSAPFMIRFSASRGDAETSLTQASFLSKLPGPLCPLQKSPAPLLMKYGCRMFIYRVCVHTICGEAWGNLLLHCTLSRCNFGRSLFLWQPLANA